MNEVKNLCGLSIAIIGMVLYGHIKEIDNNSDGKLSFEELKAVCAKVALKGEKKKEKAKK